MLGLKLNHVSKRGPRYCWAMRSHIINLQTAPHLWHQTSQEQHQQIQTNIQCVSFICKRWVDNNMNFSETWPSLQGSNIISPPPSPPSPSPILFCSSMIPPVRTIAVLNWFFPYRPHIITSIRWCVACDDFFLSWLIFSGTIGHIFATCC